MLSTILKQRRQKPRFPSTDKWLRVVTCSTCETLVRGNVAAPSCSQLWDGSAGGAIEISSGPKLICVTVTYPSPDALRWCKDKNLLILTLNVLYLTPNTFHFYMSLLFFSKETIAPRWQYVILVPQELEIYMTHIYLFVMMANIIFQSNERSLKAGITLEASRIFFPSC